MFGNDATIVEYPRPGGNEKMQRRRSGDQQNDDALPEVVGMQVKKGYEDDSPDEEVRGCLFVSLFVVFVVCCFCFCFSVCDTLCVWQISAGQMRRNSLGVIDNIEMFEWIKSIL